MRTDHTVRPSSERVVIGPIVDRQTPVKTLPSHEVSNNHTIKQNFGKTTTPQTLWS